MGDVNSDGDDAGIMSRAIRRFAEWKYEVLARKVVARMQRIAAGNIYGDDYGHKTLWDEHCYEVQNGPHDPICQSEVAALDKTGDADGFDCPLHGKFKVSSSVFVDGNSGKNATREQWEAALKKASAKTKPGEWPIIQTYNF